MLRDHGFDKYEGALAALCPVARPLTTVRQPPTLPPLC